MGSIRDSPPLIRIQGARPRLPHPPVLALCWALSLAALPAPAQTSLDTELRSLEEKARLPAGRGENLARLAFIRELAGDLEGAAAAWEMAALAAPGGRNAQALLRGASCFMALGEWERADAALMKILLDSREGEDRFQALFLKAALEGLRSGGARVSSLVSMLGDSAFEQWRPRILFSLWKLTGEEGWRGRLAEEFPRSPEGRIAVSGGVRADPSPMWLLFAAGRDARPPEGPSPEPSPARRESAPPAPGETLLQTGLFSREANALGLAERLREAGFPALTGRQRRSGEDYTAVYVRPGPDLNKSIRELRAAGFDSFPVVF